YFQAKEASEKRAVVFTTFALHVALTLLGSATIFAFARPLSSVILGGSGSALMVRAAAASFLFAGLYAAPLLYAETEQKPLLVSAVLLAKLLLQVCATIYLVVNLRMGVMGALYGGLVANLLIGLGMAIWLLSRTGFHGNRRILVELRQFGVP